jgi:nucleotide-binding universal stress UspA family protein
METTPAPTIKRIVVALDGSAAAERVLPRVEQYADRTGARITLLRAWTPEDDDPSHSRAARHEAERYLDDVADALRRRGVDAECVVVDGAAGPAIVDEADGRHADMIAMTTHARSGVGRLLLGSVAAYVSRNSACPILLVRAA